VNRRDTGARLTGQQNPASRRVRPIYRVRLADAPLVHIGYHKTASTWLQFCVFPGLSGARYGDLLLRQLVRNLATAPDEQFVAGGCRSILEHYAALSGGPLVLSDEAISGSLWESSETGWRSAKRLHAVLPRARILILVRRQDDMLRSIHGQYVNEGGTRPLRDFASGREIEGSRFALRHLEYDRLVGRYVELFGAERVSVVPYEYLRSEPADFLDALADLLGAERMAEVPVTWPNRSLCAPTLWLLRRWNRLFRASRFNVDPLIRPLPGGRRVRNLLQGCIDPAVRQFVWENPRSSSRAHLREIAASFAESNQRLQRFCRYSLAEWGYPLPTVVPMSAAATSPVDQEVAD